MKTNHLVLCLALTLMVSSCKKPEYNNPVDPGVDLTAPKDVAVVSMTEQQVVLKWENTIVGQAVDAGITTELEQSADGTNYTLVATVAITKTSDTITGTFLSTTTYSFRARTKTSARASGYSAVVSQNLSFAAPTSLAIGSMSETAVALNWTNTNTLAIEIIIEKSNNGINYLVVDSLAAPATGKTIVGIYSSDTTYSFRIQAKGKSNISPYSNVVAQNLSFPVPSNLNIKSMAPTVIVLTWIYPSSFQTGFEIYQGTDSTATVLVKTEPGNATSSTVEGAYDPSITYYFRVRAKSDFNVSKYSTITRGSIRDVFLVTVLGGTCQMGSANGNADEQPVHSVTVGTFFIDKYEITYEMWTDVRNWALVHGYVSTDLAVGRNGYNPNGTNNPVTEVKWYDAVKWCNARSEMNGLTPAYYTDAAQTTVYRTGNLDLGADAVKWTANGYRLPTEAEWEFAARGGNQTHGYAYSGSNSGGDVAWYSTNSGYTTHQVGTKNSNELGIYDMSGNVWEWCWDRYGTYSIAAQVDPKGPGSGSTRVMRSSAFGNDTYYCRVAYRGGADAPSFSGSSVGFRCVQE